MNRLLLHAFLLFFISVFASQIYANSPIGLDPPMDESVKRKLDPPILIELESLKKEEQVSTFLKVIVRTKGKMNASQEKQIEESGLTVGSILGDIFTATGSLTAVLKTATFDFVTYIELSKRLKQE